MKVKAEIFDGFVKFWNKWLNDDSKAPLWHKKEGPKGSHLFLLGEPEYADGEPQGSSEDVNEGLLTQKESKKLLTSLFHPDDLDWIQKHFFKKDDEKEKSATEEHAKDEPAFNIQLHRNANNFYVTFPGLLDDSQANQFEEAFVNPVLIKDGIVTTEAEENNSDVKKGKTSDNGNLRIAVGTVVPHIVDLPPKSIDGDSVDINFVLIGMNPSLDKKFPEEISGLSWASISQGCTGQESDNTETTQDLEERTAANYLKETADFNVDRYRGLFGGFGNNFENHKGGHELIASWLTDNKDAEIWYRKKVCVKSTPIIDPRKFPADVKSRIFPKGRIPKTGVIDPNTLLRLEFYPWRSTRIDQLPEVLRNPITPGGEIIPSVFQVALIVLKILEAMERQQHREDNSTLPIFLVRGKSELSHLIHILQLAAWDKGLTKKESETLLELFYERLIVFNSRSASVSFGSVQKADFSRRKSKELLSEDARKLISEFGQEY